MKGSLIYILVSIILSEPALAADPAGCPELPRECGVATRLKSSGCIGDWQSQLLVASAPACAVALKNESRFSHYSLCAHLYQNLAQFIDLSYVRHFGSEIFSSGTCPAPSSYPSCSPIRAISEGQFCQCPAGSRQPVAGCAPDGGDTVCMTSSIASLQCNGSPN